MRVPAQVNPFASLYGWWLGIPAPMREPVKSFAVSAFFGLVTAIGTLFGAYFADHTSWDGFLPYLFSPHSIGVITIAIAATYRATQGHRAATQTVVSGGATSIPNPIPPAHITGIEVASPGMATKTVETPTPTAGG